MKAAPALLCLALLAAGTALAQQQDRRPPNEGAQPKQAAQPSAAAGGTAPSPAVADSGEAGRLFGRFDTNGDGRLSAAELDAARADQGNWLALDRNRDGRITPDEFTALRRE
jgi:hypothetical protein